MNDFRSMIHRGVFSFFWLLIASATLCGQDPTSLPDNYDQLIEFKIQTLEQYSELNESGNSDQAFLVLKRVVDIHRKALSIATENGGSDDLVSKLRDVFTTDGEFYSDELFTRRQYSESAAIRKELEQLSQDVLGANANATQQLHWQAIVAEKLSESSGELQVSYTIAMASEDQAIEALQNGQTRVAVQIYRQMIGAQVAVLGESHPDIAANLNELGRALARQGEYSEAENTYQRSLAARQATTGRDLSYATTLFNLGTVYQETERYAEAEKNYLATAAIEEPILGSSDESFLVTLRQLGSLYERIGDEEKLSAIERRISVTDPFNAVIAHLPVNTFAAAVVEPSELVVDSDAQVIPFELIEAAGNAELGFSPLDAQTIVAFATLPITEVPFNWGVLFRLKEGVTVEYPWLDEMKVVQLGSGQEYKKEDSSEAHPLCFVEFEDGVALLGSEETVRQCLVDVGENTVGKLLIADRNQGHLVAAVNLELVRPIIQLALASTPPVPREIEGLKSIPVDANTIQLWVNMSQGLNVSLILNSNDEPHAARIATALTDALSFGKQMTISEMANEFRGDRPMTIATRAYTERMANRYFQKLQPSISGSSVILQVDLLELP